MKKSEKEFLINLFQKWYDDFKDGVNTAPNEHLRVCYTNQAAGIFEAIHYLKHKHEDQKEESSSLWNAVFAADMVSAFHENQRLRGTNIAMDLMSGHIEDAEWLADETVKLLTDYKLKQGK